MVCKTLPRDKCLQTTAECLQTTRDWMCMRLHTHGVSIYSVTQTEGWFENAGKGLQIIAMVCKSSLSQPSFENHWHEFENACSFQMIDNIDIFLLRLWALVNGHVTVGRWYASYAHGPMGLNHGPMTLFCQWVLTHPQTNPSKKRTCSTIPTMTQPSTTEPKLRRRTRLLHATTKTSQQQHK